VRAAPPRLLVPVLLAACLLSGASALVYQVLWARQLGLVMGATTAAVATVLAAFMGGLGLGSALAARLLPRLREGARPFAYPVAEAGIALSALALPSLFPAAAGLLSALYARDAAGLLAATRFAWCAALLLVPTTLMGATLPLITSVSGATAVRAGGIAGALYAANTIGAVAGCLAAPLVLLPALGTTRSLQIAAAGNLAAGALVLAVLRRGAAAARAGGPPAEEGPVRSPSAPPRGSAVPGLVVAALSGLGALAHEVIWTRALVLLVGPTPHAFALILAAVILGIGLGSAAAAPWADRVRRPGRALALVQSAAALSSLAVTGVLGELPLPVAALVRAHAGEPGRLLVFEGLGVLGLLLVPSMLFGATFPLAVSLVARAGEAPSAAVGRVLAWNTGGAVAGALLAGFVALPRLGLQATLLAAAPVHALAALAAPAGRGRAAGVAAIAACLAAAGVLPPWDRELLSGGGYRYAAQSGEAGVEEDLRSGDVLFYREGAAGTVSVRRLGSTLSLAVDGKVEATSTGDMHTQRLLAHLPLLLHPRARRACLIGLGSGVTAGSALLYPLERLDVVEISPEVVAASALFRPVNHDPLADPRLTLRVADGRNHLRLTRRLYDVVVSEPSNPWMAGVGSLFTRDFFRLVRSRLRPDGLFCQWVHLYGLETSDLRTVVAGFTDVFPRSALFLLNEGDALLVGQGDDWSPPDPVTVAGYLSVPAVREDLAAVGVTSLEVFASLFAFDSPALAAWAGDAERHTDDRPLLELRAARSMLAATARDNALSILEAARGAARPGSVSVVSPWSAEVLAERGTMLEGSFSHAWALESFRDALRLDPGLALAYPGLVRNAVAGGDVEAAEHELRRLVAGPSPVDALVALGALYDAAGRAEDAGRALEEALARDPSSLPALLWVARRQDRLGEAAAVEDFAGRAAALDPGNPEAAALLASSRLLRGEAGEARREAEAVLAGHPGQPKARLVAALAAAEAGDAAGARRHFEALLEASPDDAEAARRFAAFEAARGEDDRAIALFERAVELDPGDRAGWIGFRDAALRLGRRGAVRRAEPQLARLPAEGGP